MLNIALNIAPSNPRHASKEKSTPIHDLLSKKEVKGRGPNLVKAERGPKDRKQHVSGLLQPNVNHTLSYAVNSEGVRLVSTTYAPVTFGATHSKLYSPTALAATLIG